MATEKILNTRIINKHADLLGEKGWENSTLQLKEGEIALAKVTLTEQHSGGQISEVPAYLVKIGVEGKTFNETAWAYAKAADVHAWAKQTSLPVECGDNTTAEGYVAGNVISSVYFENGKIKYTTATVATSEGFEALTKRITAIEGYLELSQDADGNTVVGLVNRVSALETLVGDTSVSEQISSAIETLIGDDSTITSLTYLKNSLKLDIQGDTDTTVGELESALDELTNVTVPDLLRDLQGETSSTISDVESELTTLAGETIPILLQELQGDTSSTIFDVENQVTDLAGDGRTTETVKENADAIAEINTWISGDEPGNGAENRIEGLETIVHGTEDNPGGLILAANNATEHIADTSNPHNVTAAQVGLGNVENKSTTTIKSEFTGAIADGNTGFVTGDAVYDALSGKAESKHSHDNYIITCEDATENIGANIKRHVLKQGTETVCTIDIPTDLVVKSGSVIVAADTDKANDDTIIVGDQYIKLEITNQDTPIYIAVKNLVDVYTAKQNAAQVQLAISDTNEISATIVVGSIGTTELADSAITTAKIADKNVTKEKLAQTVQDSLALADSALQVDNLFGGISYSNREEGNTNDYGAIGADVFLNSNDSNDRVSGFTLEAAYEGALEIKQKDNSIEKFAYATIDLTEEAKESLSKADSAVQEVIVYPTYGNSTETDYGHIGFDLCTENAAGEESAAIAFDIRTTVDGYININTDSSVNGESLIAELSLDETAKAAISAAQTAVQEITSNCTADQDDTSGLKVTRTENSVNVEIDDSVTFIFDCGGAE